MKKLFSMVALFTALVISASCTKDGDFSNKDVVGSWEVMYEYEKIVEDGDVEEYREEYEPGEFVWVFYEDGTTQQFEYGEGGTIAEYKVSGSKLKIMFEGESSTATIAKLDSKEMLLTNTVKYGGSSYYAEISMRKID